MKFTIQKPDNFVDNYEILSGSPNDLLSDEATCAAVCKIWRQLIDAENNYRQEYGIKYEVEYVRDEQIIEALKGVKSLYLVKKESGELIGIACTKETQFNNIYYISDVAILEEFRGQGIGKVLMEQIMQDNVPGVPTLMVDLNNKHAVDLYRDLGFVECSVKMILAPKA